MMDTTFLSSVEHLLCKSIEPQVRQSCISSHDLSHINSLITNLFSCDEQSGAITVFHAASKPSISVYKYLHRIIRMAALTIDELLLGTIYIFRILHKNPTVRLCELNVHRLLLTSLVIARKYLNDYTPTNNAIFAKIGGIIPNELIRLEVYFLKYLDYNLYVSTQEYFSLKGSLFMSTHSSSNSCRQKPTSQTDLFASSSAKFSGAVF